MLEIRHIRSEDVSQIAFIEQSIFSQPWLEKDFLDLVDKDDRGYIVIEYNSQVIGGCAYRNILGDVEISNVEILKEYRGKGYSKLLLEKVLSTGREIGGTQFTLEVRESNIAAIALYEKMGFVTEGVRKNFYDFPKENALIMWLR